LGGDPFARLGLPRAFQIGANAVSRARVALLARLHPDRFADEVARAEAVRDAAEVNEAATALRDPIQRAEAILQSLDPLGRVASLDPKELAELLARREAAAGLVTGSSEHTEMVEWIDAEQARLLGELGAALDGAPPACEAARRALSRYKAIVRLEASVPALRDRAGVSQATRLP